MTKNALGISVIIAFLIFFEGSVYSTEQNPAGTQEESNKELRIGKTPQNMDSSEEGELLSKNNFLKDLERFLDSQFPNALEEWRRHPRYWKRPSLGALFDRRTLPVDIIDQDTKFLIKAELPGVDKKDIHITISDNVVTLEADTYKNEDEEKGEYYRREISRGVYSRTLMLPAHVKEDEAKATFEGGVLKLTIPKTEKTTRITIDVE